MRKHHRCPKCHGEELIVGPAPFEMALGGLRSVWTGGVDGPLEAWLCKGCGYLEFYLKAGESLDLTTWRGAQALEKPTKEKK